MKKTGNIIIGFALVIYFFGMLGANAQQVSFTTQVSKKQVAVNEKFQVSYTLNDNGSNFTSPNFKDFRVYSGPNQSSSMQWINGKSSSSITYSFVLAPKQEGTFNIPGASIQVNGKTIQSQAVRITVIKTQAQNQQQQSSPNNKNNQQATDINQQIKDNVFLKVFINKRKAVVNEEIVVTFKIYTRLNIVQNSMSKLPEFSGFIAQDIELPNNAQLQTETYNGTQFNSATLKQTVLYPQKTGKLVIDPMSMDLVVRVRENSRGRSIFDSFFGGYKDYKLTVATAPIEIEISNLPTNPTAFPFKGAVGNFNIQSSITNNQIKANEAINLKIQISGSGNLDLIQELPINFPPDFEVYDPKITNNFKASANGVSGKKVFDYLIIPRHSGKFSIPEASLVYFNPNEKKYNVLKTQNFEIEVERDENEEVYGSYAPKSKKDLNIVGSDIRFIKTNTAAFSESRSPFFGSKLFYFLIVLPFLLMPIVLIGIKKIKSTNNNKGLLRKRKASKMANTRLNSAQKMLKDGKASAFYAELYKAIMGFIGDKFLLENKDLTRENIKNSLESKGIQNELITEVLHILQLCEMASYSPVREKSELEVFNQTKDLMVKMQKELK